MERLTFVGNFCDIAQCSEVPGGSFCEDGACSQKKVWERLKAYEDRGCEPEEVLPKDKADEIALKLMRLADLEILCSYDRLRELAEADKDGRVVVLPCKVGDVMYKLFREYTECTSYQVRKDNYCCEGCMVPCDSREVTVIRAIQPNSLPEVVRHIEDIGKTVFLTREEAEKALQEMEGKKDG